jgi:hypothetical protein
MATHALSIKLWPPWHICVLRMLSMYWVLPAASPAVTCLLCWEWWLAQLRAMCAVSSQNLLVLVMQHAVMGEGCVVMPALLERQVESSVRELVMAGSVCSTRAGDGFGVEKSDPCGPVRVVRHCAHCTSRQ